MAKMFYSAEEAAERLGKSEEDLKELVRAGKLREFRDAGKIKYKLDDVDGLASGSGASDSGGSGSGAREATSGSASGEIVLEPVEESGIELAASGSDILSLEEVDASDTASGTQAVEKKKKEGTVVPSVGVNVFDDDELDDMVDPLAQTAVTDVAGMGIDGAGSGSGILDLTRESDDTSLGSELLEEIYTGEGEGEGTVEMGEATRAGLDEAVTEPGPSDAEEAVEPAAEAPSPRRVTTAAVTESAPDAISAGLTALMVVGVVVLWFGGLAAVALLRGVSPKMVTAVHSNLALFAGGAALVAALAAGVTYFLARRSS